MVVNKKKVVRKRTKKIVKTRVWPRVTLSLLLLSLLVGSIGAAFFVIFFSVPAVQASEMSVNQGKIMKPRVAIIIDDMGYNQKVGEALIQIPYDLSFSFLPFAPFSSELQRSSYLAGKVMLLHLPLQPTNSDLNLEPNSLLLEQSIAKQKELFAANVAAVPFATGLNNHMGSLYTADQEAMNRLLQLAAEKNYFFVDSVTTVDSVGEQTAIDLGMRHCKRDVFLDNVAEEDAICKQLDKLVSIAEKRGSAIGIGHPYPATLAALQSCLKTSLKNLDLVPVDQLVE